jgi:hypothetical protein
VKEKSEKLTPEALLLQYSIWLVEIEGRYTQGQFAKAVSLTSGRISQINSELVQRLRDFVNDHDLDVETMVRVFENLRKRFPDKKPKDF